MCGFLGVRIGEYRDNHSNDANTPSGVAVNFLSCGHPLLLCSPGPGGRGGVVAELVTAQALFTCPSRPLEPPSRSSADAACPTATSGFPHPSTWEHPVASRLGAHVTRTKNVGV